MRIPDHRNKRNHQLYAVVLMKYENNSVNVLVIIENDKIIMIHEITTRDLDNEKYISFRIIYFTTLSQQTF